MRRATSRASAAAVALAVLIVVAAAAPVGADPGRPTPHAVNHRVVVHAGVRLVTHPASRRLEDRLVSQRENLAHARYVCRRGRGPTRRWACSAKRWLNREAAETKTALENRQWRAAEQDWLAAVKVADRAFPGTAGWLLSCSSATSEGGWGRFVWNGGSLLSEADRVKARDGLTTPTEHGSGAGGWLQFKHGTWDRNAARAFAEATSRGVNVPLVYRSFYSRIGQAVVGASMLLHGQRGEWSGSGCG